MPILLTTPIQTGDLEPGPYTHVKIRYLMLQVEDCRIEICVDFGRLVSNTWVGGLGIGVAQSKVFSIANKTERPWTASTPYIVGDKCSNGGNNYTCTVAGTSDISGPSGTSSAIADGTITWRYGGTVTDFNTMVLSLPSSGTEKIYDGAARCLYQWLINCWHYAGTIV